MVLAVVVVGTWFAARHFPNNQASAAAVADKIVRTQEVQSVSIDTPCVRSTACRDRRRLPLAELRSVVTTKPGELLDEAKLDADRRAIEQALVARGYLAARVAAPSVTFSANGGAFVVFDVDRGPMFRLRSITVTGPGEDDIGVVTISPGDDAVPARIERARQTLQDVLAHRASKARVEAYVHEDFANASVDVELATIEVTVLR